MTNVEEHNDITNRMSLSELISTPESFEKLRGMLLLFNRNSEYYKFSGMVTAALFNGSEYILATYRKLGEWFTFHHDKESLTKMLMCCDAFVGESPKTSFLLVDNSPITC